MLKIKNLFVLTLAAFCIACGDKKENSQTTSKEGGAKEPPKTEFLSITSGSITGIYYPLANAISKSVANVFPELKINVESSGGSVANLKLLQNGDADLGMVQNDIAFYAYSGTNMFEGQKFQGVRGITTLYSEIVHIIARKSSGIKSVKDLKGKRVSVGAAGSGTSLNAEMILGTYGMTFEDLGRAERISITQATDFFKDGKIDAIFYTAGLGNAAITDISLLTDLVLIPIDQININYLIDSYNFYTQTEFTKDSYKGVSEPVKTVAVKAMLATSTNMTNQTAYRITKALFEQTDELYKGHAKAKEFTKETALKGMSVPVHEGAMKYYKEIGLN